MAGTCNSCGSFDQTKMKQCSFCPTIICDRCRVRHETVCEQNQRRKRLGLGPTIRENRVVHIPTAAPIDSVDQGLAAVAELLQE